MNRLLHIFDYLSTRVYTKTQILWRWKQQHNKWLQSQYAKLGGFLKITKSEVGWMHKVELEIDMLGLLLNGILWSQMLASSYSLWPKQPLVMPFIPLTWAAL